jgi:hypothetical protein
MKVKIGEKLERLILKGHHFYFIANKVFDPNVLKLEFLKDSETPNKNLEDFYFWLVNKNYASMHIEKEYLDFFCTSPSDQDIITRRLERGH